MSQQIFKYHTLKAAAHGRYHERGSKFIAVACPISSLDILESALAMQRTEHPKARHVCYAYRILEGEEMTMYSSDAGEPPGSAGKPILGVILHRDLVNAAVIVARYFGGTKLGIPGLIAAYGTAAQDALSRADIYEFVRTRQYSVDAPMALQPHIIEYSKRMGLETGDYEFDDRFRMRLAIPLEDHDNVVLRLLRNLSGKEYGDARRLLEDLDISMSGV